jgi:hypothetical protein
MYIPNDSVVHEVGVVKLNGTTLSSDKKLYSGDDVVMDNSLYVQKYELSNLTPIENLKD